MELLYLRRISRCLFKAVILVEGYNKGWRDLEEAVWSFYIGRKIWREPFRALIFEKGYYKKWRDLFRVLILAEIYYKGWIDLEKAIWNSYI